MYYTYNKYLTIGLIIIFFTTTGCYTYNIPSGATVPLITEAGETKATFNANFNELGGTVTVGLNEHAVFSASGQAILWNRRYDQHYDSVMYRKTPNNFEVAFGYHGHQDKYANLLMFGIGTGNNAYTNNTNAMGYGYYQTEYIQYFLQYTAGVKYDKHRYGNVKQKEQGISFRYAYHEYGVTGIESRDIWEEVWNEAGYWDYVYYTENFEINERGRFNSFSIYYFYRTGNERVQFEISPGYTFYGNKPKYSRDLITSKLHFNVGAVFRLNHLF
jgi:hypothetical protein